GARAANARYRFARACTGLQGAGSGGESDLDHVVAAAEKTELVGQFGASPRHPGPHAAVGNDRGSGAAQGVRHRSYLAVLQSSAQNQNTDLVGIGGGWALQEKTRRNDGRQLSCGELLN